jgi:integrase
MTEQLQTGTAFRNFSQSLRSAATKKDYIASLSYYMAYLKVDDYEALISEPALIQSHIIDYLIFLREERKLSPNTIRTYVASVKRFYDMNDVSLNWRRIFMYQGEHYKVVDDTAYSSEQIKILLDNSDMRDKAIILLLASSGMRGGALPKLKLKDLTEVENLYKVRVYKHTHEQYYTFTTPECRQAITLYLEYRKRHGERITQESPLFRWRFNPNKHPELKVRPITFSSIASMMCKLLNKTGVRPTVPLKEGKHPEHTNLPMIHSFRKFFVTQCIRAKLEFGARESLTGHRKGLDSHYDRRDEGEILQEYSKAINFLTIDPANRLQHEVKKLKEENNQIQKALLRIDNLYEKLGL